MTFLWYLEVAASCLLTGVHLLLSPLLSGGVVKMLALELAGKPQYEETGSLPVFEPGLEGDKIHVLRTITGDAILLESDGHFALVDAGDDAANPTGREDLAFAGTEYYVADYIKRVAGGKLDFAVGTHAHNDHIGAMDEVLLDPAITCDTLYLKRYTDSDYSEKEQAWDNDIIYDDLLNAAAARGIAVEQDIAELGTIQLGNFKIKFLNTGYWGTGALNDDSLGMLLTNRYGRKAFLAADISGPAVITTPLEVGKVDFLKGGHHGRMDGNLLFCAALYRPKYVAFTHTQAGNYAEVDYYYTAVARSNVMYTGTFGGVVAVMGRSTACYAINEYCSGAGGAEMDGVPG
ncbi:MAG: MBL fold metallo-hydrolase [Oscillospiraceae bacterium]|jgi:beta-lactamase superfamily II metal-dependent hydrolase|nr:MBL fold metallo-hydrolase [Oscillospiraceae bacterium]